MPRIRARRPAILPVTAPLQNGNYLDFLLLLPAAFTFLVFIIPRRATGIFYIAFSWIFALLAGWIAAGAFLQSTPVTASLFQELSGIIGPNLDPLSAFFILVINFSVMTGSLYARPYLRFYDETTGRGKLTLHLFSLMWLQLSMTGVLIFDGGIPFLVAWELMAVSSFMLILFEAEKRVVLKTAVNYFIQMHVGFVLLAVGFLLCSREGGNMSFSGMASTLNGPSGMLVFCLFFAGFAIKAGFFPLHTWLPRAHPAAPSHVSGMMSGVMIKLGIYGILRVMTQMTDGLYTAGIAILVLSLVTAVFGALYAVARQDLKKLLAYCSIENIGIIGAGIGIGAIGLGTGNTLLAFLGLGGALLHTLNHSLAKSLLFFSSGAVYQACHTRNIDNLGGLFRRMPATSLFFLTGSVAICGLPPLNGFISEFLIVYGMFTGMAAGSVNQAVLLLVGVIGLVVTGGLSIFAFTKAFGIAFLGNARSEAASHAAERPRSMAFPQLIIFAAMIAAGFFPLALLAPVSRVLSSAYGLPAPAGLAQVAPVLTGITILTGALSILMVALWYLRRRIMQSRGTLQGETWGCGYTAGSAKQQYTGSSWADSVTVLAGPMVPAHLAFTPIEEAEVFPGKRTFTVVMTDAVQGWIGTTTNFLMLVLKRAARLQTGNIQHYILYAFIFILALFALLYLGLI